MSGLVYVKEGHSFVILLDGVEVGWLRSSYGRGWQATGLPWFPEHRTFGSMRDARIAIVNALIHEEEKGHFTWP